MTNQNNQPGQKQQGSDDQKPGQQSQTGNETKQPDVKKPDEK